MVTMMCGYCRFKYNLKGNLRIPPKCGNCGRDNSVQPVADAQQIIRESDLF